MNTAAPVKIGLLGLGTVGGGTVSVLARNAQEIARRAGSTINIHHAAAKTYKADISGLERIGKISDDVFAVVEDPEVDIVVELLGGCSPAKELILKAIANKKHIVTANKALIATHGNEIFAAARKHGSIVAFEAAVAGGIPLIKAIREGLTANRIQWIAGIINGTGNYILTQMRDQGRSFSEALQEAQDQGYAEADPRFDIEGIDAAHKLAILGTVAFDMPLQFDKVYTEGVTDLQQKDVTYAAELGYYIKHLGIARHADEGIELRVHPTLIPKKCLLANVNGVMNAALVMGNAVGPTLYYGAGAGAEPTASAVIADIVDIIQAITANYDHKIAQQISQADQANNALPILAIAEVKTAYYLRMQVLDRPGVLAEITRIFGDTGISIEAILQKEPEPGAAHVPIIFLSQRVQEKQMDYAITKIAKLSSISGDIVRIRLETLI